MLSEQVYFFFSFFFKFSYMSYLGPDQYQYVDVVPQYKNL